MIKSELVTILSDQNPHLYRAEVETIVNTVFSEISDALANGALIGLRGFGTFSVTQRAARIGRNPKTGERVEVEAKAVPRFKVSRLMAKRLNRTGG